MSDAQPLPAHFPPGHPPSPDKPPGSARGEFILSGTLTPLVPSAEPVQDLPAAPAEPMPAFHLRAEVKGMLERWRNRVSLYGWILSSPSGSRQNAERFVLPQHTMYIK